MPLPQPRAAANIRGRAIALPYGPRRALRRSPVWPEAQNLFVGAGFIPPGVFVPPRGFPGAQCAPLQGGTRRGWVCGWPQGLPQPVGADSISARKPRPAAKPPGQCKHRPLHRLRRRGGSRFAAGFASPRRAGVHARRTAAIPKPECSPRRGVRRDEGIPPYGCPGSRSRSGLARNIKFIRRGGIYPVRGCLPHRRVPGRTMCAPTRGARWRRVHG